MPGAVRAAPGCDDASFDALEAGGTVEGLFLRFRVPSTGPLFCFGTFFYSFLRVRCSGKIWGIRGGFGFRIRILGLGAAGARIRARSAARRRRDFFGLFGTLRIRHSSIWQE
eukprot:scaffold52640_cov63-Phaeocystis_antarctica.AAC.2